MLGPAAASSLSSSAVPKSDSSTSLYDAPLLEDFFRELFRVFRLDPPSSDSSKSPMSSSSLSSFVSLGEPSL